MTAPDAARWRSWIGCAETSDDTLDLARARAMQATLDDPNAPLQAGQALPPLWHWIYFWSAKPHAALGPDGHAARGGFLPPIDLPRRMWAGSRVQFHRPLPLGEAAVRRSTIADMQFKQGRSGRLAFVTVRHEVSLAGMPCLTEEYDIVYSEAARPGDTPPPGEAAPQDAPWSRVVVPDPVLLFRYSALTFNGHRIHYDQPYATAVEGYPGLVVHGPLLATFMAELARAKRPRARLVRFEFRALSPIFDTAPFTVAGRPEGAGNGAEVWVADPNGRLAMRGRAEFA